MKDHRQIIDSILPLQKYPGKGGWTYAEIPGIKPDGKNPFGWMTVSGTIDDFILKQYKLMPSGKGNLFLPVKKEIRQHIKKEAGDFVHIKLFRDNSKLVIPQEIVECFKQESEFTYNTYKSLRESEQKAYLDWIYSARTEETKAKRILKMMEKLKRKLKFHDKE